MSALRRWLGVTALALAGGLVACSSTPSRPAPTPLAELKPQFQPRQVWRVEVGAIHAPLLTAVKGDQVAVASSQGTLAVIDAATGQERWRLALGSPVVAGVGGDGERFAVITANQQLVVAEAGRVLWRAPLAAVSYTPPLVAGGRVFVLTADRVVTAFDGSQGRRLWSQGRTTDPLVLRQPGLLMAYGDSLLAGLSGRMVAMSPDNGSVRWDVAIGTSRGVNEIERLVDVVAGVYREGSTLCARAFQSAVTCVDGRRAVALWTRNSQGYVGVAGDAQNIYGVESDGKVLAWARSSGEPVWTHEGLRFRGLTAPLQVGGSVVVGDEQGVVHWLAAATGQLQSRTVPDGSAIASPPVLAGKTLVVVTAKGSVSAYRAD